MQKTFRGISRWLWLLPVSAVLLVAADPAWRSKPAPSWNEDDAKQVLYDSPWSKVVIAGLTRLQNEDERREGGNMGQSHGVGYDGVGEKPVRPKLDLPTVFTKTYTPHAPEFVKLLVRWETALPVRVAELKAGELDPPTLDGEGYKVAVYGVPGPYFSGDPKKLGDPLRKLASLKREGKPDVKPGRAEVFQKQGGMVVVYLFPLSAEINKNDALMEFSAQIGRIVVRQVFDVWEMRFQGTVEL